MPFLTQSFFTFGLDLAAVALPVGFMYLASAGRGGCGSSLTSFLTSSFFTRFAGVAGVLRALGLPVVSVRTGGFGGGGGGVGRISSLISFLICALLPGGRTISSFDLLLSRRGLPVVSVVTAGAAGGGGGGAKPSCLTSRFTRALGRPLVVTDAGTGAGTGAVAGPSIPSTGTFTLFGGNVAALGLLFSLPIGACGMTSSSLDLLLSLGTRRVVFVRTAPAAGGGGGGCVLLLV